MKKEDILKRMVLDERLLEAWRSTYRVISRNKGRYSFKAWLFCRQMIQVAERLRAENTMATQVFDLWMDEGQI